MGHDAIREDTDSRWLLRGIGYALLIGCVLLGVLAIVFGWPAEKVGNGLQLLGLLFAALGVPVVSPWLGTVERWLLAARDATARQLSVARAKLRRWWARLWR